MPDLNWLATVVAALLFFVLGAVWFAEPVLKRPWMKSAGLRDDYAERGSQPAILGTAFVFIMIMAVILSWLTVSLDFWGTVLVSLGLGLGVASLSFWMLAMFERKPHVYSLINGGYLTVGFLLMGVVLGAWK